MGLRLVKGMNIKSLEVKCDCDLVVNQVNDKYTDKGDNIKNNLTIIKERISVIKYLFVEVMPREKNQLVGSSSKVAFENKYTRVCTSWKNPRTWRAMTHKRYTTWR